MDSRPQKTAKEPRREVQSVESPPPRLERNEGESRLYYLRIRGRLRPDEQARLTDIIEKAQLGMKSADLSVQFESGVVFIPRVTEYIIVTIVQAIRTASSEIEIHEIPPENESLSPAGFSMTASGNEKHEEQASLPQFVTLKESDIDALESLGPLVTTALLPIENESAVLQGPASSEGYSRALERMKLEIRNKAKIWGAAHLTDFQLTWEVLKPTELHVLALQRPELYHRGAWKLTATALARRVKRSDKPATSS